MARSIHKAVEILDALAREPAGLGARALEGRIGLPRSTVQRLLEALEETGMVKQDEETHRYVLGVRTLQLGVASLGRVDVRTYALPHMRRLRDLSGETVGLNIRAGDARMYIEQIESPHQLRSKAEIGQPYPLYSGAPGRILLAFLAEGEIARILEGSELVPLTASTPVREEEILASLRRIRSEGIAAAFAETIAGLNTLAAPIRGADGGVVAALSVSGPETRFAEEAMRAVRPSLIDTAAAISSEMGYSSRFGVAPPDAPDASATRQGD